jgi:endonuclease/exonuclease/phosphatase family metal-dependent hydrolase
VSWNLQHGVPDPVGPPDLARAVNPLRALAADVYALQELDRGRVRTRWEHQGALVADGLDGELVFARAKHRGWAAQGNALVVRGEVVASERLRLPGSGELRVATLAIIVVCGARWTVATAHLSLHRETAQHQLHAVMDTLTDWPPPRVLIGDLNLQPDLVEPVANTTGYHLVDGPCTVNARKKPDRRIDHVLVQGAMVIASGVAKLPVSDHLAVWADLARAT